MLRMRNCFNDAAGGTIITVFELSYLQIERSFCVTLACAVLRREKQPCKELYVGSLLTLERNDVS
jgi:hypothetical protein